MKIFIIILSVAFLANSAFNTVITMVITESNQLKDREIVENALRNETVIELRNTIDILRALLITTMEINLHNEQLLENGTLLGQSLEYEMIQNQRLMNYTIDILYKMDERLNHTEGNSSLLLYQNLTNKTEIELQ